MARNGSTDCAAKQGFLGAALLMIARLSSRALLAWLRTRVARPISGVWEDR
jgi:hypothetical protein